MTAPEREEDVVAEGATTNQTSEDEEVLLTEEDQEFVEQRVKELETPVQPETGYDCFIVVDNLPKVNSEKYPRLYKLLQKIFSQCGKIRQDRMGIYMPKDPKTDETYGFAFIEYATPQFAATAVERTNGFKLDRSHVFSVNRYSDFQRLQNIPEKYVPPEPKAYKKKRNLRSWLMNTRAADQFVVRYADETEIFWHEKNKNPESVFRRRGWTDTFVAWSPLGTYMATFHKQGIILWGGESTWEEIHKFPHEGVGLIHFSPCETYLVTLSPEYQEHDNPKDPQCIVVWDIKTGRKMRGFTAGKQRTWPAFKWSHDDKYFARISEHGISVYQTPNMGLLNKKSISVPGIKDFDWSPSDHVISCWTPETGNTPAKVMLIEIPSRKEKRQKALFNVNDVKMHWQSKGDFLCVKVDRHTKSKKFTNFEIFRMREKGLPIEVLELQRTIVAFAWEPYGTRFAMIHSDGGPRPDVSFYDMGSKNVKELTTLSKRPASHLFWSPRGRFICIAGLKNLNGALEFFDTETLEVLGTTEHVMATDIEWDPTGRFVVSSSSAWRHQFENGYNIWTFQGVLVNKVLKDRFFQFLWRPRPPSLLSEEKKKEIQDNLKRYAKRYAKEDMAFKDAAKREKEEKRIKMYVDLMKFMQRRQQEYKAEAHKRRALRGGEVSEDEVDFEEEVERIEEIIEEEEELLDDQ